MFTGIVEDVGRIRGVSREGDGARVTVETHAIDVGDLLPGESVAVDGACLTVVERTRAAAGRRGSFGAFASGETLARTTLGERAPGDPVNLERAVRLGDRLGGHVVQGHVDATGTLAQVDAEGDVRRVRVAVPAALARYLVVKGSIAIDGVSLTINALEDGQTACLVAIVLVPHTLANTALASKKVGARVNIEADVLAKHLERLAFFRGA